MSSDEMDLRPVLEFVRGLRRNNKREWFEAHRATYVEARRHFESYVGALITALRRSESLGALSPADCIFRMNRDLRFSRDKTPYKPYMSAYIAPGGRKSRRLGYYVHLESGDHSILGGGLHKPEPRQLAAWRASIDRDPRRFKSVAAAPSFRKYFGTVHGDRVKTAPKGYARDHPDLELLQLKSVMVSREMSDRAVASAAFFKETLATFKAMRPFLAYLEGLG
jgi:uncharacterized protein (TIGR02453 family)